MTDQLPPPLVPAEVDLRGLEWMPYYGDRLMRSEFNARCSDAAFRAAHNLWWAAWNNEPAASLPDDDVSLTRFADLGRDTKAFSKVRTEALHGFIKCSDGRLYHPFLAKLALEAWDRRSRDRDRKAKWRATRTRDKDVPATGTETGTTPGQRPGRDGSATTDRTGEDRTGHPLISPTQNGTVSSHAPPSPPSARINPYDGKPSTSTAYVDKPEDVLFAFEVIREKEFGAPSASGDGKSSSTGTYSPKDLSIAAGWLKDGVPFDFLRNLLEKQMASMAKRRVPPPTTVWFFHKSIADAAASDWQGYRE